MHVKQERRRDSMIEVLRFAATIWIVAFHYEWLYVGHPVFLRHGYIFVEFFFVLSGFFLVQNVKKGDAISYLKAVTFKLYVPYIFAFIFSLFVYCKVYNADFFQTLYASKWELLMMQLSGLEPSAPIINGVTAYIPALLVASAILHFLINEHFSFFRNVFGLLVPIFIYSHMIVVYGNLSQWNEFEGYFTIGILRGLAGMTLGAESYIIVAEWCKRWNKRVRLCVGMIAGFMIAAMIFARDSISYSDEVIYPYVFAVLLSIIYSREEKVIQNKISFFLDRILCYLGKMSYGVFLMHYGVCKLLAYYFPGKSYLVMMLICIGVSIILGAILMHLSNRIMSKFTGSSCRKETKLLVGSSEI